MEEESKGRLTGVVGALWRLVAFFVAFGLFAAVPVLPLSTLASHWQESRPLGFQLCLDMATLVGVLLATWFMVRFAEGRSLARSGFPPRRALPGLALGLVVGGAWLGLSVGGAWAGGWLRLQEDPVLPTGGLAVVALSFVFNVAGQQLLFFGYPLQVLEERVGFPAALVLVSAAFSAVHLGGAQGAWLPALNVFAAGCVFCLAYKVTRHLWFPMGIHYAWNLMLGPVLGLTLSGARWEEVGGELFHLRGPALVTGGAFGLEGGLVVTLTTLALLAGLAGALVWSCSLPVEGSEGAGQPAEASPPECSG